MTARSALTVVGEAVGGYFGGSFGAAVGGFLGGAIGGAIDGPVRSQQSLIDDLNAIKFDYGSSWPRIYGRYRFKVSPMWTSTKRPVAHEQDSGDGKGGPSAVNTSFTYEQDWMCWAPLGAIGFARIWINGAIKYSALSESDAGTFEASANTTAWRSVTFRDGNELQDPWAIYEAAVGVDNAVGFIFRPTLCFEALDLGGSGAPPLVEVEYFTNGSSGTSSSLRFDVPFTGHNATDITADPATPVLTNSSFVDFSVDGQVTLIRDPSGNAGQIQWSGTKLQNDGSARYTLECLMTYTAALPGPDTAQARFMRIFNAAGSELEMGLIVQGGILNLITSANVGSGGSLQFMHGTPTSNRYRIVADGGQVFFYNGDNLLRIDNYDSTSLDEIAIGVPAISANLVDNFIFDRIFAYYGSSPTDFNIVDPGTVLLGDIVRSEALLTWSGEPGALTTTDIDASALDAIEVTGYASTGSPRESITQAADMFYFGAVCSDKLYFRLRGASSIGTVPFDQTGIGVDQAADPFTGVQRGNDLEIAIQVAVTGPDLLSDYEPGTENSDRLIGESVQQAQYNTPFVFTPTQRKGRADTMVLDGRVASHTASIAIDDRHVEKEPFDVWTQVDDQGNSYRVRSNGETYADGVHVHDVVLDDVTVLSTVGITSETDTRAITVASVVDTVAVPLDIPNIQGVDIDRGIYVAAKPAITGPWSGYSFSESPDDVAYSNLISGTKSTAIGSLTVAPGAFTGGRVFDEINTFAVDVGAGTLASSTRDAIIADETVNAFALGRHGRWVLGQFRNAALQSAGVYKLSGIIWGSRGTEQYIGTQVAGDTFVLLKATGGIVRATQRATDQGASRFWKAVSVGKSPDAIAAQSVTEQEVGLMPLSPWDIRGTRSSGDLTITWQRRSRLATRGSGSAGILIPLGEESEAYSIDIFSSSGYTTIKRTLSSSTPTVVYTSAQQVTDFGTAQSTVYARVYQLSAAVGRGFPAQRAI